mmetsp:Transcript_84153/g.224986  ORF Transcript_84153/g.224986 Transcript_84153/m.224986 type:complete len:336 (-) Transcript_84153:761-1768(-)
MDDTMRYRRCLPGTQVYGLRIHTCSLLCLSVANRPQCAIMSSGATPLTQVHVTSGGVHCHISLVPSLHPPLLAPLLAGWWRFQHYLLTRGLLRLDARMSGWGASRSIGSLRYFRHFAEVGPLQTFVSTRIELHRHISRSNTLEQSQPFLLSLLHHPLLLLQELLYHGLLVLFQGGCFLITNTRQRFQGPAFITTAVRRCLVSALRIKRSQGSPLPSNPARRGQPQSTKVGLAPRETHVTIFVLLRLDCRPTRPAPVQRCLHALQLSLDVPMQCKCGVLLSFPRLLPLLGLRRWCCGLRDELFETLQLLEVRVGLGGPQSRRALLNQTLGSFTRSL